MAYVTLNKEKLKDNFNYLNQLFNDAGIKWSVVSKLLCGNKEYVKELLNLNPYQVCDSRITNLKTIKAVNPYIETVYIKPPAKKSVKSIIKYADISMNTDTNTIRLLSEEAEKQNKIHKIIIMIDLGELREGVMAKEFIDFYEEVFKLKSIKIVGIGTNLACLNGVLPNPDKLIQLSLYQQLIEAKFDKEIEFVSGGSTVTIPLVQNGSIPEGINHLRIGEALFLGTCESSITKFEKMHQDIFKFHAQIIELIEKPTQPYGQFGVNVEGDSYSIKESEIGKTSMRAIIDIGLLDVDLEHITFAIKNKKIKIVGGSSDMIVIDLGENENNYKVGDFLQFKLDYMGLLKILNSKYIEKLFENNN